jgi:hypothetical protein
VKLYLAVLIIVTIGYSIAFGPAYGIIFDRFMRQHCEEISWIRK